MKSKNSFGVRTILGIGIAIGLIGVGTAIGLATDELVMGLGLGLGIGVGIVLAIRVGTRSKNNKFDKDGYLKNE